MSRSSHPHPWWMLALSTIGQAASSAVVNGAAFLIPALHAGGLSLSAAGTVAAASVVGGMCTLVLWGAVVDRIGERLVLTLSLGIAAISLALAAAWHQPAPVLGVLLFVAGAAGAGTGSASGRVVVGWFAPRRRGTAMGVRQTAQPVGVGIAAVLVPVLAARAGVGAALGALAAISAVAALACALWVVDPPRPEQSAATPPPVNPYRADGYLARIHAVSMLLVIPQFAVWTFMLVWLQVGRGWAPGAAGALVAVAQVCGAAGRIGAGHLSDVVGSRMRPLRWVAIAAGVTMVALGLTIEAGWWVAIPLIVIASTITVADNGLAFTAVAERAGPFWSGRALGLQNTGQFLVAAGIPPLAGWLVPLWGYGAVFGLTGLFPLLAVPLVPKRDQDAEES